LIFIDGIRIVFKFYGELERIVNKIRKLLDMESELYLQHISCRSGDMDGNESENFVFAHISCRWIWTGKRKVIVK